MERKRVIQCIAILLSLFLCSFVASNDVIISKADKNVTIDIVRPTNVDIVFSSRDTNRSVEFKQEILAQLAALGVDTSTINVQSVDSQTADLKNSFTWKKDVSSSIGSITTTSNSVNMVGNKSNAGKICTYTMPTDNAKVRKITFKYNIDYGDSYNGAGMMFNISESGTILQGYAISFNNRGTFSTSGGNGSLWKFSWTTGTNTSNVSNFTKLSDLTIPKSGTLTVQASQDKVVISGSGSLTYNLDKTYGGQGFGFFSDHYSHGCNNIGKFNLTNISMSTITYKLFKETLQEPDWQENALHVAINDDAAEEFAEDSSSYNDVLSRTLNNHITYFGVVPSSNTSARSWQSRFVKSNNSNGAVVDKTSSISTDAKKLATQISEAIQKQQQEQYAQMGDQYILCGETVNLNINPASYKDNPPESTDFPYGRWKVLHDYIYYENNQGQAANTGVPTKAFSCGFEKPGKYDIYFDDDLIKTIYVHRAPVASFNIARSGTNVTLTNQSYDLDSNIDSGNGKGIQSAEWKYQKYTEDNTGTWTTGKLTKAEAGESYVVSLTVTDLQGAKSSVTKYIGAGLPVADFSFASDIISKYSTLEIVDNSYDPSNLTLKNYYWKLIGPTGAVLWSANGNATSYLKSFKSSSYPTGKYKYSLIVTNSNNKTSEEFSRSFTIVPDTIAPSITIDVPSSDWVNSVKVNFSFADSDSGFSYYKYYIDNAQTMNNSKLGSSVSSNTGSKVFGPTGSYADGRWFLHLYAADVAGNVATVTYGPYQTDNQKPSLTVSTSDLKVDDNTLDSTGTVVIGNFGWQFTITAVDPKDTNNTAGSGIAKYALTKTASTPLTNIFKISNKFTVNRSGTYYLWVMDNAGNVSSPQSVLLQPDITLSNNGETNEISGIVYNGYDIESVIYNHTMLRL